MGEGLRIVFYGADDFGVPSLKALSEKYAVVLVVTYKDLPGRRNQGRHPTPIKVVARELGLPVCEVSREELRSNNIIEKIKDLHPDLGVVISFAVLPEEIVSIPVLGTINLHPSILPSYRGPAPINWAIIKGETRTGITTFVLGKQVDAGDIILQEEVEIMPEENAGELRRRLAELGVPVLLKSIELLRSPGFKPIPQPHNLASRAPKILAIHRKINWHDKAINISNLIRGLAPTPGAVTIFRDMLVKVLKASTEKNEILVGQPGEILGLSKDKDGLLVATGNGTIVVKELQPEGKKIMQARDFWNGYKIQKNELFQ